MNISAPVPELNNFLNQLIQACQSSGMPIKLKITLGSSKRQAIKSIPEKITVSPDQPVAPAPLPEAAPVVDAMPEQLLSTEQAANILGVSKETLNKYRDQGWLVGRNMNKHDKQLRPIWKYRKSDLENFIKSLDDK